MVEIIDHLEVQEFGINVSPVVQQDHIADSIGTTDSNQTAINSILSTLETFGLTATS